MSTKKGEGAEKTSKRTKMSMEERIEAAVQRKIATMAANGVLGTGKKGTGMEGLMNNPMMMMMMMGGGAGGLDIKNLMLMQMMSGQGGGDMSAMLPLMLLGGKK
jgi:hypothetical protein